jgi:hypothetical protein
MKIKYILEVDEVLTEAQNEEFTCIIFGENPHDLRLSLAKGDGKRAWLRERKIVLCWGRGK